jgi:hypothetical protein
MVEAKKTPEEVLTELLLLPVQHKIFSNSQGGYDCKCGARWDWQRSEKLEADTHAAKKRAQQLLAAGVRVEVK